MTYKKLFEVISKPWANINDIKHIANCGRDSAILIRNTIINEIKADGKHLPTSKEKIVPMDRVINYFNIDVDFIYKMAQKQIAINE